MTHVAPFTGSLGLDRILSVVDGYILSIVDEPSLVEGLTLVVPDRELPSKSIQWDEFRSKPVHDWRWRVVGV